MNSWKDVAECEGNYLFKMSKEHNVKLVHNNNNNNSIRNARCLTPEIRIQKFKSMEI